MPRARRLVTRAVFLVAALCAGCAAQRGDSANDPLVSVNRKIFWFNEKVDDYVLAPVATGWDKVVPAPAKTSISNFSDNLRFPVYFANDLLQAKPLASIKDVGRFFVNSTAGLLGLFDPATELGMPVHYEDFGQTLGYWGVPPGPYLMLPIWGSSNPRDLAGRIADIPLSVMPLFLGRVVTLPLSVMDVVNTRSQLLNEVRNAKAAALDYYVFIRDAYAQRRAALIKDTTTRRGGDIYGEDIDYDVYDSDAE